MRTALILVAAALLACGGQQFTDPNTGEALTAEEACYQRNQPGACEYIRNRNAQLENTRRGLNEAFQNLQTQGQQPQRVTTTCNRIGNTYNCN